jgi:hypothetical protein
MDKEKIKILADNVHGLLDLYDNREKLHILLFKECLKYLKDIETVRVEFLPNEAPEYWARLYVLKGVLADVIKKGEKKDA